MKKYFAILMLVCVALISNAQMATLTIPVNNSYISTDTNYTLTNAVTQYLQVNAPQNYPTTQDFVVNLDSLSGNHTHVAVALYGRKFDTSAWTAIGSAVTWTGTTADTTIVISNATANRYRAYKVLYTGTGTGTTRVDLQQFKLYFD